MYSRGPAEEVAELKRAWSEEYDLPILLHQLPPLYLHCRCSPKCTKQSRPSLKEKGRQILGNGESEIYFIENIHHFDKAPRSAQ